MSHPPRCVPVTPTVTSPPSSASSSPKVCRKITACPSLEASRASLTSSRPATDSSPKRSLFWSSHAFATEGAEAPARLVSRKTPDGLEDAVIGTRSAPVTRATRSASHRTVLAVEPGLTNFMFPPVVGAPRLRDARGIYTTTASG